VDFGHDKLEASRICGNGILTPPEQCDDGNLANEDGCDDRCRRELGWLCAEGSPSACHPICGDGLLRGDEACDGWNLGNKSCESQGFESGTLTCGADCMDVDVSQCTGICGDNQAGGLEECDGSDLRGKTCLDLGFYAGALGCESSACTYDTSGCIGRCGDGILNGSEPCDGELLNGWNCLNMGHYGGTLSSSPDCRDFDISGCHVVPRIRLNELQTWLVSSVELLNASEVSIDLQGYVLRIEQEDPDGSYSTQDLALPSYVLGPGGRVVLKDTLSGSGSPPTVNGSTIQFNVMFYIWRSPGAISFLTPVGAPTDFLGWGGTSIVPQAGTSWSEIPAPIPTALAVGASLSLGRLPDGADGDRAGDFCFSLHTLGSPNTTPCETIQARGSLLVTEVDLGPVNGIELYNPGSSAVNVSDWMLEGYSGGGSWWGEVLPDISLGPHTYLKVVGDLTSGSPYLEGGALHIYSPGWTSADQGAVWITEPMLYQVVDRVQWGTGGVVVINTFDWYEAPQPLDPPASGSTLGRRSLVDTDSAGDWCPQSETLGAPNGGCL
jgi:cysteine-rich repeat protein